MTISSTKTLDDIDDLTLIGKNRLDEINEYDIRYYIDYLIENYSIMNELIINIQVEMERINDNDLLKHLLNELEKLKQLKRIYANAKPMQEFQNGNYPMDKPRPYAYFVIYDFAKKTNSFSEIIEFMNNVFEMYKRSERKGDYNDAKIIWSIFKLTKRACSNLGIFSPDAYTLYDMIANQDVEKLDNLNIGYQEFDEVHNDIQISTLPYLTTIPEYNEANEIIQSKITLTEPTIDYSISYLQKLKGGKKL